MPRDVGMSLALGEDEAGRDCCEDKTSSIILSISHITATRREELLG